MTITNTCDGVVVVGEGEETGLAMGEIEGEGVA
jgi:hypothetical protein